MPQQSDRVVRMEIQVPVHVMDAFTATVDDRRDRNAWINYLLCKHLGLPYKARKQGRPRKKPE